ncbi:MAG: NADP-specific glutamate dehydrogenase, partial [Acholeplasmatales bacterium]|nr:NADP-specific glutamate dehydrogenase [Acholeplasmatales bacterium]
MFKTDYVKKVFADLQAKNSSEPEFLQAAQEILSSLEIYIEAHPELEKKKILERFLEPERFVQFKVVWTDDNGNYQVNRGYRIQYNSAI